MQTLQDANPNAKPEDLCWVEQDNQLIAPLPIASASPPNLKQRKMEPSFIRVHLVGDGREKAAEAITAFWLPFALEQAGEDPAKAEAVARDCVMLLEQQIYLLRRRFNLMCNYSGYERPSSPSPFSPKREKGN